MKIKEEAKFKNEYEERRSSPYSKLFRLVEITVHKENDDL